MARSLDRKRAAALAILVLALWSLSQAPRAAAETTHVLGGSFGSATTAPANPYPISDPKDVDVDQTTHDVYVTDPGNRRVEKFDADGNFILMFGKEVNETTGGNVCPVTVGDVCKAGAPGVSPGAFEEPLYVAVDNDPGGEGDVYIGDPAIRLVQKFDSSGHIIASWGNSGQKDGADNPNSPLFNFITGLAVGGGCATPAEPLTGPCSPNGTLYVRRGGGNFRVFLYSRSGTFISEAASETGFLEEAYFLDADAEGHYYFTAHNANNFNPNFIWEAVPVPGVTASSAEKFILGTEGVVTGFALDRSNHEIYQDTGTAIVHYSGDCRPAVRRCEPNDSFGTAELQEGTGVAADWSSHTVYVADTASDSVFSYTDVRPKVTTGPPADITQSSAVLTGSVELGNGGNINSCIFEYGYGVEYGRSVPCVPDASASNYAGPTTVTAAVGGFSPGTRQHYRVVVTNVDGATSRGADETFVTNAPPAINGLFADNLTATTAELRAKVNPNGLPTRYIFEYGPTIEYGSTVSGNLDADTNDQDVVAQLANLQPKVQYHYRLIVDNTVEAGDEGGVTVSEDQTFNFYPPRCPNGSVRQQTGTNYLPDCRAYELVSPSNANGTQLFAAGPNTGYATNPSRLAFTGNLGAILAAGGSPLDTAGDLYVATRTEVGWKTRYVGFDSDEAAISGGPPQGLWGQGGREHPKGRSYSKSGGDTIQTNVLTDPGMNRFVNWNDGPQEILPPNPTPVASNAAHVWNVDGTPAGIWPTNLATVPAGVNPNVEGGVSPGGMHALDCAIVHQENPNTLVEGNCPGEVAASGDLSHFVFSSVWNVFAPGGQTAPPGSVYDNNTETGEIVVVSKTPSGEDIPREPGNFTEFALEIPSVSADGSHILIGSPATGPCGASACAEPPCGSTVGFKVHCPPQASHLYLRVDDSVTYDVSQGRAVSFIGGTADLAKIYFTSPYQQTSDDNDSSIDLYMWSQAGAESGTPLTLVSRGVNPGLPGEPGDADSCHADFVANCGVTVFDDIEQCQIAGGVAGDCRSDSPIASDAGDIYFFSPEQLEGSRGQPDKENLYLFRNGQVRYVTTLTTGTYCYRIPGLVDFCGTGPITRMQVTRDGRHMAFLTASPVTQSDNNGKLEMYRYDPDAKRLSCVSCSPDGAPPTVDVGASQSGLFLTNDGRAFFSTEDPLVHGDTNKGLDIYEYADGRPQLITTGTGDTRSPGGIFKLLNPPGLVGVSADGRDAYFATYETLVREDRNGLFLKFYDARVGGGFPAPAPPPPCEAADECHGAGSAPPPTPRSETSSALSGGNQAAKPHPKKRRKHKRSHRPRRHKHARHVAHRGSR
jgi:hypothetical protein